MKDRAHCTAARLREIAAASIALCAAMALTACGGGEGADSPVSASSTSPRTPKAPSAPPSESENSQAAQKGAILQTYNRFWEEKVKAYAKASVQGTDLKKYAVAEAFTTAETEVQALKAKGLIATGKPDLAPEVTSVDNNRKVPQGTISDCTDVSDWTLVRQSSGAAVTLPEDRLTKYVTKAVAEKWYGRWVIVKMTPEDRSC
ncbi:hypothetical protein [Streptomyces sp. NPDC004250]|uniref:hypothetical protein n=1 Tax=Streptomyces sp. NPDC004250 TaxID=3364692 RepID=UPI0036995F8A